MLYWDMVHIHLVQYYMVHCATWCAVSYAGAVYHLVSYAGMVYQCTSTLYCPTWYSKLC